MESIGRAKHSPPNCGQPKSIVSHWRSRTFARPYNMKNRKRESMGKDSIVNQEISYPLHVLPQRKFLAISRRRRPNDEKVSERVNEPTAFDRTRFRIQEDHRYQNMRVGLASVSSNLRRVWPSRLAESFHWVWFVLLPLVIVALFRRQRQEVRQRRQKRPAMEFVQKSQHLLKSRSRSRTDSLSKDSSTRRFLSRNRSRTYSSSFLERSSRSFGTASNLDLYNFTNSAELQQSSSDLFRDADIAQEVNLVSDEVFLQLLEDEEYMRSSMKKRKPKKQSKRLSMVGPNISTIEYNTVTPPPPLDSLSRNMLVPHEAWKLSRVVTLELMGDKADLTTKKKGVPILSIQVPKRPSRSGKKKLVSSKRHFRRSVNEIGLHVQPPPEGGVLEIYVCDTERREWMEHTFDTAAQAAQFQMDVLSSQFLGPTIHSMYQSLAICQQGSLACPGRESVLHHRQLNRTSVDKEGKNSDGHTRESNIESGPDIAPVMADDSGVAWDDVMRCLGSSFPSIRLRLEAMWWLEVHGSMVPQSSQRKEPASISSNSGDTSDTKSADDENMPVLTAPYRNRKRLLLGPVDFFRLFIPNLPETAVPDGESSRLRLEQILRWRKRVARACVLVQSYASARTISNMGWTLEPHGKIPDNYLRRRLAFDDDEDNKQADLAASNVYYEAAVSRDVYCQVRGSGFLTPRGWWNFGFDRTQTASSLCQGFSLVGMHVIQWGVDDDSMALHYTKDPVLALSSLHTVIASQPQMYFFVNAIFLESKKCIVVQVFVRSLPSGIDSSFDNVLARFVSGDEALRKRKLEVILQLGTDLERISFLSRLFIRLLSFLLRIWPFRKSVSLGRDMKERQSIPAINLSSCGTAGHFGGALQADVRLPRNYVSNTLRMSSSHANNFVARILLCAIESGGLSKHIWDFTFVLAGEREDELPERALCTARIARLGMSSIPVLCSSVDINADTLAQHKELISARLLLKVFVQDPTSAIAHAIHDFFTPGSGKKRSGASVMQSLCHTQFKSLGHGRSNTDIDISATDPLQKSINEIVHLLADIRIPVSRDRRYDIVNGVRGTGANLLFRTEPLGSVKLLDGLNSNDIVDTPILNTIDRHDIHRYLIASNCNLKKACTRIVDSAIWRGRTFPVDTRACRVELQNGQFFQQGFDLEGNPVFYFRNTCLGPWREDEDANIKAVLHRLESRIKEYAKSNPYVQCTLIVVMGRPYKRKVVTVKEMDREHATKKKSLDRKRDQGTAASTTVATTVVSTLVSKDGDSEDDGVDDTDDEESAIDENDGFDEAAKVSQINNPRLYHDELWNTHTTKGLIERLVDLALLHYPERLSKVLVVVRHGNRKYIRSAVGGIMSVASVVQPSRTREKIKFLRRYRDLQAYIDCSQLVTLVGGTQVENLQNYECD